MNKTKKTIPNSQVETERDLMLRATLFALANAKADIESAEKRIKTVLKVVEPIENPETHEPDYMTEND